MTATSPPINNNTSMSNWPGGTSSKVLLLSTGGYPASSVLSNQTYLFNGTTPNWSTTSGTTVVDSAGPLPCRSASALSVSDGTNLVLFGGNTLSATGFLNDTWTYASGTWTKQSPTTSPSARGDAGMAYLSGTGAVLFGGQNLAETPLQDTWVYASGAWSQVSIANGSSPAARSQHAMASSGSLVLMVGGKLGGNQLASDVWSYTTGGGWVQKSPTTFPQARAGASLSYDSNASLFVLYGGFNSAGVILNDLWTSSNGTSWTQVTATGTLPPALYNAQMCYDTVSSRTILFGGFSAELGESANLTYSLNASTNVWTQL
jgi:Galactose oxidase, central domain